MHKHCLLNLFFVVWINVHAQHQVLHTQLLWYNYNNIVHFNNKWALVNDVQVRTRDWGQRWSQFALRSGLMHRLNKSVSVTGGFTWFGNVRYFNEEALVLNEWRPWEEIAFQKNAGKNIFLQRLRLEQRFLQTAVNGKRTNEYEKRQRLRYRFEFAFPFAQKKFELHAGNEVMVNLNYISGNRFFDQNRSFAFINCQLSESVFFQFQYLKIFLWQPANNILENQDVFRFSIHQQIFLRR